MEKGISIFIIIIFVFIGAIVLWKFWPATTPPVTPESDEGANELARWDVYRNQEYGFELKYPGVVCQELGCVEWDVREEASYDYPVIIISPKDRTPGVIEENSMVQIYPEGLATGLLPIADEYLRKEEKIINGASASIDTYLTEGDVGFQWFVRFLDYPDSWSEYNFVFAFAESELERKCGGLPAAEVENLDICVGEHGWTLSGRVNEEDAEIIRRIISTIKFDE